MIRGRAELVARLALLSGLLFAVVPASAQSFAPEIALRPISRPAEQVAVTRALGSQDVWTTIEASRPRARPPSEQGIAMAALGNVLPDSSLALSLRPAVRPDGVVQQALFKNRERRRGSVCGDIEIQGSDAGVVKGSLPGCGVPSAVRVRSVAGVTLSREAVMSCDMAKSLKRWVERDVETAFGRRDRVASLRVAAGYACRTRNNQPGGRISEHGKGRAIDISGFTLESGETITVLRGWQDKQTRKKLRKIWKAACGQFKTVLGPEADRYHRDHFHLDVAQRRGGTYCR